MPKRRKAKSGARQPEAIAMLIQDHQKVQKLFRQFRNAESGQQRTSIAGEACNDLTVHTRLEEEIFYPAVRQAIEDKDLIEEAEVEHGVAKELIEKLKGMDAGNGEYSATFTVLGEYVEHHIEEEQNELFPKARKADIDFEALGNEMHQRKKELREELGLAPEPDTRQASRARQPRRTASPRSPAR